MSNDFPRKLRDTLASQNKTSVYIVLSPTGEDQTFKFNSDDFDIETKEIANSMVVGTIQESNNRYKISTGQTEIRLTTENGIPLSISDEAPGGDPERVYLRDEQGRTQSRSYFIDLSNPGIYNSAKDANGRTGFDINVVKGKAIQDSNQLNYDNGLRQLQLAVETGNESPFIKKIGTGLKNNNTFYPTTDDQENIYAKIGTPEENSNIGRTNLQPIRGTYQRTFPIGEEAVGNDGYTGKTTLTSVDFKGLGLQIPLRGSGELYVPKFGSNQTTDAPGIQIIAARGAALAPGLARLGLRIPVNDVTPISTLDNDFNGVLSPDKKLNRTSNFPDLQQEEILSYGSYNNWIAPFDGIERLLQMPALAIQVGAIALIVVALAEILQGITGKDTYSDQVRAGFISFFGLQSPGGNYDGASFVIAVATAIISGRMINETGWYGTVVRGFIKSLFQEISRGVFAVAATGNFNGSTSILNRTGVDIYSDGIDGDVVGAAAKIIELFFNSKLVGFTNMLAQIGEDQVLPRYNTNGPTVQPRKKGLGSAPRFGAGLTANQKSFIDSMIDGTETSALEEAVSGFGFSTPVNQPALSKLIFKDRLNNHQLKGSIGRRPLAWGSNTTPSSYLLPQTIKKAALAAGGDAGLSKLSAYYGINAKERISQDDIAELESALDASYMPFYLQDMRTGEILSFHAFIENMEDSFQADYEQENGFGRVEKTITYKNTSREMGIDFWIVATNPEDHDEMWLKINKLVTLVYPQYTPGRALQSADGQRFIQPFSQLIGAGPLVRLRVGDVWKSNYSRFNVMRLFGLGKSEFNLNKTGDAEPKTFETVNNSTVFSAGGTITTNSTINYKNKIKNMLRGEFAAGDQILMYYSRDMDNRVFGRRYGPGASVLDLTALLDLTPPRELYVTDLLPGMYTLQIERAPSAPAEPIGSPIREYAVKILEGLPEGVPNDGYILRCANLDKISVNELSLVDQLGETFQARFSAFEGTPTQEMWERSVAYSSLSTKLNINYNWLDRIAQPYQSTAPSGSLTDVNDKIQQFFKTSTSATAGASDINPIMQAFENNKGMGIAGFIKSLRFDWKESTWETDWNSNKSSSRAPMSLKVSLQFAPIHDITPGIDSDGFITSPVYPVGRFSNALNNIEMVDRTEGETRRETPAVDSSASTSGAPGGGGGS